MNGEPGDEQGNPFSNYDGDNNNNNNGQPDANDPAAEEVEIGFTDFAGIKTIDEVTDTTIQLSWDYHEDVSYYVIHIKELAPQEEEYYKVAAVVRNDQTSTVVSGLKINTSYSLRMNAYDRRWRIDDNEVTKTVQTTLAPMPPVSVMLKTPATSPGFSRQPSFTVRYVKPGEVVRLFSDADCTQELGQATVDLAKTTVDISSTTMVRGVNYEVYANTTSIYGHTSACSNAYASYKAVVCPDDSYAPVESNEDLGTDAFCVFKTEARSNGNGVPISSTTGDPWKNIKGVTTKTLCQNIEVEDGFCDLISNPEWMVIARDIEATAANWSMGEVGKGKLNRGHSDKDPNNAIAIVDPSNPWDQTYNSSGFWFQKRTFVLSSGEVLWDFAGNLEEWVDWTTGSNSFSKGPTNCPTGSGNLLLYECASLLPNDYLPGNPARIANNEYNYEIGIGIIKGTSSASAGAVTRGGSYLKEIYAGIFDINFSNGPADWYSQQGFRCVWRPQ